MKFKNISKCVKCTDLREKGRDHLVDERTFYIVNDIDQATFKFFFISVLDYYSLYGLQ